jgi:hypothetical protein
LEKYLKTNQAASSRIAIPRMSRMLAIVTGILVAITGALGFGPLFAIVPSILIIGAATQNRTAYSGRWLTWLGALLVTMESIPLCGGLVREGLHSVRQYPDFNSVMLLTLSILSLLSVALCDLTLVIDAVRIRRGRDGAERPTPADWLVWLVAGCVTVWLVPAGVTGVFTYRHSGRVEILMTSIVFSAATILLDIAIIIKGIRACRIRGNSNLP